MIVSLPMYDWPELQDQTDRFWAIIAGHLNDAGFDAPQMLNRREEGEDWLSTDLLFSQTCGYPFSTQLRGRVQLLATPHYGVEGCDGATYSSALIVRADSGIDRLADTVGKVLAYNGSNSLSGFRCLTPTLSPLNSMPESWFGNGIESGSHRASAIMVARGEADVAAVDAVCWHFFQKFEPESAQKLKVLMWTRSLPALPYITRLNWTGDQLTRLREAVLAALTDAARTPAIDGLALEGGSLLGEADYAMVADY